VKADRPRLSCDGRPARVSLWGGNCWRRQRHGLLRGLGQHGGRFCVCLSSLGLLLDDCWGRFAGGSETRDLRQWCQTTRRGVARGRFQPGDQLVALVGRAAGGLPGGQNAIPRRPAAVVFGSLLPKGLIDANSVNPRKMLHGSVLVLVGQAGHGFMCSGAFVGRGFRSGGRCRRPTHPVLGKRAGGGQHAQQ